MKEHDITFHQKARSKTGCSILTSTKDNHTILVVAISKKAITNFQNYLFLGVIVSFCAALVAFYFHAIDLNPQADTQGIRYSLELGRAWRIGGLWDWLTLLPPYKYPLLYFAPFTFAEELLYGSRITLIQAHYITRFITLIYALGTIFIVRSIARDFFGQSRTTIVLLCTSITFFMYATAVRPHIVVTFWTILSLFFSTKFSSQKSLKYLFASYAAAACAFATLQSGIFAYIFPMWALLSTGLSARKVLTTFFLLACFGVAGLLFGYPYFIHALSEGLSLGDVSAGMNHGTGTFLNPSLIPVKIWHFFTTDIFLVLSAIISVRKTNEKERNIMIPLLIYMGVFFVVFGMQPITSTRFFLPTVPMLAICGTKALLRFPKAETALSVLCVLVYAKCTYLGVIPNTFQQASTYVMSHEGLLITSMPSYFLNIPRIKYANKNAHASRFFYLLRSDEHIPTVESLPLCASFTATTLPTSWANTTYMFFWNEVEWPYLYLFNAKSLGTNLRLYCQEE